MTSLRDIATGLLQKTAEGKVMWAESGDQNFIATLGDQIISISRVRDITWLSEYGIRLSLLDSNGRTIESDLGDGKDAESAYAKIYELARRQALQVDKRIDHLKHTLESL